MNLDKLAQKHNFKKFTLIELFIVGILIGIMTVLSIPFAIIKKALKMWK